MVWINYGRKTTRSNLSTPRDRVMNRSRFTDTITKLDAANCFRLPITLDQLVTSAAVFARISEPPVWPAAASWTSLRVGYRES